MRSVGLTLVTLLAIVTLVQAQPPGPVPGAPPVAPPTPQADPRLDKHLLEWEKKMGGIKNFRADIEVIRTDSVFKKERKYGGGGSSVLCMKPNYARLRLDNTVDKNDYEAYICNGQYIYEYNGLLRTVTEIKLAGNPGAPSDNLMLDFLSGMKADDVKRRFEIKLFNEDQFYVYLEIKPILGKDKLEFTQVRFALYGPNTKYAYLPAQVWMMKPNQDTELWKFTNPQTDLENIDPSKVFVYQEIPGWAFKKAPVGPTPPGPGPGPGGPGFPPIKP
jgi:TIGR03009 family protein